MSSKTLIAALVLPCALAHAQALRIETLENGPWPQAVAAVQANRASEGTDLHVIVRDDTGRVVHCGAYALSFDAIGAAAFRVGTCNPGNDSTSVTVISRHLLFGHDSMVPRPLAVGLTATEVRTGAIAGGAAITGGSTLDCSVAVRPYLDDLENGQHVYLTPDRYVVVPRAVGVQVETMGDGWLLRSGNLASLTIDYDVTDRSTGEAVLHDRATLLCASGLEAAPLPDDDVATVATSTISVGEEREGDTSQGIDTHTPSCGSSAGSPDETWVFRAPTAGQYRIDVSSSYDGVLAVYPHDQSRQIGCNDDNGSTRASQVTVSLEALQAYDLVVDGYHGATGHYTIRITGPVAGSGGGSGSSQNHGDDTMMVWGGMFLLGSSVWLTAGLVLALSASADHDELRARCAITTCTDSMLDGMRNEAQWADISFGLALGQALLGTLFVMLGLPENNGSSAQLTPNGFRVRF